MALRAPLLLFLVMAVGPALIAVEVTQRAFSTGLLALEVAVVTVFVAITSAGLWWAFTGGRLVEHLRFGRFSPTFITLAVAAFAVATFAGLTSVLYLEGALEISGEPIPQELLIEETSEFYVWHLTDTVPLLDIPGNLEWKEPFEFEDRIGGLLLIVFTGIVIIPLVQVVRVIAAGHPQPYEEAVLKTLRKKLRGWRVRPLRGKYGSERAVVEHAGIRILVDVMQGVWTEDAPLRRLGFIRFFFLPETEEVNGYVLVVDIVGERARDRIVDEFERSAFPAALAVWRSDERGEHLARVVKDLAASIAPAAEQQPDGQAE